MLANTALYPGALQDGDVAIVQRCRNLIASATAYTAHSIANAYRDWLPSLPDDVFVNGGGCRNPTLMRMLGDLLTPATVAATDVLGVNGDAKEAMLFALMAHDALAGLPTNIPRATGASRPVVLGKMTSL
jgi:anhydro-N-acetylmuramic acid kinase